MGHYTVLHCRWASEPQVCELCPKFNLLICEMRESNMMISFFDIALFFFLQKHYIFATKNTHHKTLNYKKHKEKNKESRLPGIMAINSWVSILPDTSLCGLHTPCALLRDPCPPLKSSCCHCHQLCQCNPSSWTSGEVASLLAQGNSSEETAESC